LLVIPIILISATSIFAPAFRLFALNHEEKQCAGFWGGDEYVTYELPPEWKTFEFKISNNTFSVTTDVGTCQVPWGGQFESEKSCCSQLGYTYVSENIGTRILTSHNLTEREEQAKVIQSIREEQITALVKKILAGIALLLITAAGLYWYPRRHR
jgi:hypothetical protein